LENKKKTHTQNDLGNYAMMRLTILCLLFEAQCAKIISGIPVTIWTSSSNQIIYTHPQHWNLFKSLSYFLFSQIKKCRQRQGKRRTDEVLRLNCKLSTWGSSFEVYAPLRKI